MGMGGVVKAMAPDCSKHYECGDDIRDEQELQVPELRTGTATELAISELELPQASPVPIPNIRELPQAIPVPILINYGTATCRAIRVKFDPANTFRRKPTPKSKSTSLDSLLNRNPNCLSFSIGDVATALHSLQSSSQIQPPPSQLAHRLAVDSLQSSSQIQPPPSQLAHRLAVDSLQSSSQIQPPPSQLALHNLQSSSFSRSRLLPVDDSIKYTLHMLVIPSFTGLLLTLGCLIMDEQEPINLDSDVEEKQEPVVGDKRKADIWHKYRQFRFQAVPSSSSSSSKNQGTGVDSSSSKHYECGDDIRDEQELQVPELRTGTATELAISELELPQASPVPIPNIRELPQAIPVPILINYGTATCRAIRVKFDPANTFRRKPTPKSKSTSLDSLLNRNPNCLSFSIGDVATALHSLQSSSQIQPPPSQLAHRLAVDSLQSSSQIQPPPSQLAHRLAVDSLQSSSQIQPPPSQLALHNLQSSSFSRSRLLPVDDSIKYTLHMLFQFQFQKSRNWCRQFQFQFRKYKNWQFQFLEKEASTCLCPSLDDML
ncbi:hypothetical protein LXL04_012234 [Taraxacum kok-saghyz]